MPSCSENSAEGEASGNLRDAEARTQAVLEAVIDSIITIDESGTIESANSATQKILGYAPQELVGKNIRLLMPSPYYEEHDSYIQTYLRTGKKKIIGIGREVLGRRKDGSIFPMDLSVSEFEVAGRRLFTGICRDITERVEREKELSQAKERLEERVAERTEQLEQINKELRQEVAIREQAEKQLQRSLKEKEVLLKEIHHRVKNNLQLISSLLSLQTRNAKKVSTEELVYEIRNRIQSISLLHEMLYLNEELSSVDFAGYLEKLAESLLSYYGLSHQVTLNLNLTPVMLVLDQSIPCGLLANEIVTNVLKHAFPDQRGGILEIGLSRENGKVKLLISDNGVGLPENISVKTATSLGLELIRKLAKKLRGTLEIESKGGTRVTLIFQPLEVAHD